MHYYKTLYFLISIYLIYLYINPLFEIFNTSVVPIIIITDIAHIIASRILNIVAYICYVAAFILLIMLGIKYMTAAPDGKAEVKKMAVIYVIGAILVFATGIVLNVISNTATNVLNGSGDAAAQNP